MINCLRESLLMVLSLKEANHIFQTKNQQVTSLNWLEGSHKIRKKSFTLFYCQCQTLEKPKKSNFRFITKIATHIPFLYINSVTNDRFP